MADLSWTEPESAANTNYQPVYPLNHIVQTESGHSFEMDDTETRERVRLQHRYGTFIEMHPNGDEVHKIIGNGYEIIANNKNVLIKGVCNITVQGDSVLHIQGDSYNQIDGSVYQNIKGNVEQSVQGNSNQIVNGDVGIDSAGEISLTGSKVNIFTDLYVAGDINSSQSIHAEGNMTAALSVSADKSVETLGYMVAGTSITAGVSVYGPMVSDIFGELEMLRLKIDQHVHIGNLGYPTSPPTKPMEI